MAREPRLTRPDMLAKERFARSLGERIAKSRRDAQLTSDDLASRLGVSRGTLSTWENGRAVPDAYSLFQIADSLGEGFDELLMGEDDAFDYWYDRLAEKHAAETGGAILRPIDEPTPRDLGGAPKVRLPEPVDAERLATVERQLAEMRQLVERLAPQQPVEVAPAKPRKRVRSA